MSDRKVIPTQEASFFERLTGEAKPVREATTFERITGQATPVREATWLERMTGEAQPTREATTLERITGQATPVRQATWFENLLQGHTDCKGAFSAGQKSGRLAVILLVFAFCTPGLILDKIFPDRHGNSRLSIYSTLFWTFVAGTVYLEHHCRKTTLVFILLMSFLSLLNIALGLLVSEIFIRPQRLPDAEGRSENLRTPLQWLGWLGLFAGSFCSVWSLAAHWPQATLLPCLTSIAAGFFVVRLAAVRVAILRYVLALTCIVVALYQLTFGWRNNLVSEPKRQAAETLPVAHQKQATADSDFSEPPRAVPAKEAVPHQPILTSDIVEMPAYDWGTSGLTHAYYLSETAGLFWWLADELQREPYLKHTLEQLAEAIHAQADGCSTFLYGYSKVGDRIWASGAFTTSHKWDSAAERDSASAEDKLISTRGFICFSGNNGRTWNRQWFSERNQIDPVYDIYFSDQQTGWALSSKGILHTSDAGETWNRVFANQDNIGSLFILPHNRLMLVDLSRSARSCYLSEDGAASWIKAHVTATDERVIDKIKADSSGKPLHFGGIYPDIAANQESASPERTTR